MALIATLTDTFTTQDTTKWTGWAAGQVEVVSGQLRVTPISAYNTLTSAVAYSLAGSSFAVEVVQRANQGNGSVDTILALEDLATGNEISIIVEGSTLYMRYKSGGVNNDASLTYNATDHRWWRISESGGTVTWATSPDGTTWTARRTASPGIAITDLTVWLQSGYWGTEPTPGVAIFDNVNVTPTGAGSGTAALSTTGALTVAGGTAGASSASALRLRGGSRFTLRSRLTLRAGTTTTGGPSGGAVNLTATGTLAAPTLRPGTTGTAALTAGGTLTSARVGVTSGSGTAGMTGTGTLSLTGGARGVATIIATTYPTSGMVRVAVDFSGLTPVATSATIHRIGADGSDFRVRGAEPMTLSSGAGTVDDFEIPLDVDCYYTVSDDQGRTASSGTVTIGSDEAFGVPTAWITDPARPGASVPVAMAGKPEWTYPAQSVRLDIIGRPRPVAVSSARGSKRGTLTFVTLNPLSIDDVRNVFATGQVLLLRAPAGYRWGNMYFDAGDVREAHAVTVLRHSSRTWTVDVAEVDRPTYASQGFANTWTVAAGMYGTWGTMAAQTWLTVMQGADPAAAGTNTFVNPIYGGTVL